MKVLITLVALLATSQTFSADVGPGGYSPFDQCFPTVELNYFTTHSNIDSFFLATQNQEKCRAERFKVAGY